MAVCLVLVLEQLCMRKIRVIDKDLIPNDVRLFLLPVLVGTYSYTLCLVTVA